LKQEAEHLNLDKTGAARLSDEAARELATKIISRAISFAFRAVGAGLFLLMASRAFSWLYYGA